MKKGKRVRYACVSAPSSKAESLKKRAMFGESLGVELNELATAYSKIERDPMNCGRTILTDILFIREQTINVNINIYYHCNSEQFHMIFSCKTSNRNQTPRL